MPFGKCRNNLCYTAVSVLDVQLAQQQLIRCSNTSTLFSVVVAWNKAAGPRRDGTFEIQWIGTLVQFKRQKKVKVAPLSLILLFITTPSRLPVGFHDLTLRWRVKNLFYILYGLGRFKQWNERQYTSGGTDSSVRENRRFKGETQFGSLNLSFELSLRRHVAGKDQQKFGALLLCSLLFRVN